MQNIEKFKAELEELETIELPSDYSQLETISKSMFQHEKICNEFIVYCEKQFETF